MRILHIMLSSFYIEGYNYQENALPRQNALDGHDVRIIASTVSFIDNSTLGHIQSSSYRNKDGIDVTRMDYINLICKTVTDKIRAVSGLYKMISEFMPDVILFHGAQSVTLLDVVKYKKKHPNVKLYIDNHSDDENSAHGFLSNKLQHDMFYRLVNQRALPFVDKYFYISLQCKDFLIKHYRIPERKMEFYPLGGFIVEKQTMEENRRELQIEYSLNDNNIVFMHTGKIDKTKRSIEIVRGFSAVKDPNIRLFIVGQVKDDVSTELNEMIAADNRIMFVGWKNSDELTKYLCLCDVYIQLGGQSATMQSAMCCGCAVLLYPHRSHKPYVRGNGFYIKDADSLQEKIELIVSKPDDVEKMKQESYLIAGNLFDYRKLAARLYTI